MTRGQALLLAAVMYWRILNPNKSKFIKFIPAEQLVQHQLIIYWEDSPYNICHVIAVATISLIANFQLSIHVCVGIFWRNCIIVVSNNFCFTYNERHHSVRRSGLVRCSGLVVACRARNPEVLGSIPGLVATLTCVTSLGKMFTHICSGQPSLPFFWGR